jgi:hypothetical protein
MHSEVIIRLLETLYARIVAESFAPLGWFATLPRDGLPSDTKSVVLIGNAGPAMFERFARERDPEREQLDLWTREVVNRLAASLGAGAVYPFEVPSYPFLRWAGRAGAGRASPLGLNIHPVFGLWHAYRAALLFPMLFDGSAPASAAHPCDSCADKPCLTSCPVTAFDAERFDVAACVGHLGSSAGRSCLSGGCLARRACPVGREFAYGPAQAQFHMHAFMSSQAEKV